MTLIEKKLQIWEQQGLLTGDQYEAILSFEQGKKHNNNWWLYSLLILGSAIIGLGIISLIAANWVQIPDSLKLGTDFSLLVSLAVAIFWYQNLNKPIVADSLIAIFMILCLASIGLIAQIYHINGRWYHAIMLWSVICLPIALFARHVVVHFLWVSLFINAAVWSSVDLAGGNLRSSMRELPAVLLLAPLLSATLYLLARRVAILHRTSSSFFFWFQISALIALIAIDLMRSGADTQVFDWHWYLPAWLTSALLISLILLRHVYKPLNKALLIAAILLLVLYYEPSILFTGQTRYTFTALDSVIRASLWSADDIRAPVLTILILFLYAIHAGNSGYHRTFNLITFLIGLRFVVLYFQAMGGLAATGIGLILSGLMIIGIAWFWYSSRDRLQNWSQELTV
ncbi:DUF2157 domain-containing protein [uncultured Thiothrix sp.]|jgi:uncharacterized membrane protein|uniref:DUF2157 domain-containing protein n=1 Tax=uncultured Thiothrix sp. TaxID=223185 RepID=UPI0026316013|nr:DUF2157 domain-containing protein [uncultured Thiothrix sp.]HMT93309.1 DUF2157 domain-containing protein [Thiolinea sp.]